MALDLAPAPQPLAADFLRRREKSQLDPILDRGFARADVHRQGGEILERRWVWQHRLRRLH